MFRYSTCCLFRLWEQSSNCSSLVSTALPSFWRTWEKRQFKGPKDNTLGINSLLKWEGWGSVLALNIKSRFSGVMECICKCGQAAIQHFLLAEEEIVRLDYQHPASDVTRNDIVWKALAVWQNDRRSGRQEIFETTRTLRSRARGNVSHRTTRQTESSRFLLCRNP